MKVISGGQTGVDRAALDAAIAVGFDYGGSIPLGRKAEDGFIDLRYTKLNELPRSKLRGIVRLKLIGESKTCIAQLVSVFLTTQRFVFLHFLSAISLEL